MTCTCDGVDERVERPLERAEPQPVVDQLGPPPLHRELEAPEVPLDGEVLQLAVCGEERDRARRLVDFAALDADQPVLDHVQPPHALGAGAVVQLEDCVQDGHPRPSTAVGTPSVKLITTSSPVDSAGGAV